MTVKTTAIKTAGLGCIKGETKTYEEIDLIEDMETYFLLGCSRRNAAIRISKANWKIEIVNQ